MKKTVGNVKLILLLIVTVAVGIGLSYYFYRGKRVSFLRTRKHFSISTDGIKKATLKNGMTVLVYPDHSVPKVLVQIAYDIGAYVEQDGERGMAHLIEHMIFKGTNKLSESDIDEIARKYGATHNAFTSMDVTSYYFEANRNNWKPFVDILADCMQNARFDEQHLASELKAVVQELKMYRDDYWSMMFQKVDSLLYPAHHPYHHPIIGYKDDLMHLSTENLKRFYKKYYHPRHATLFVVGDVDPEEVIEKAREQFEHLEQPDNDPVPPFSRIPNELVSHSTRCYEDVKAEQLGFYWRIPGKRDKDELLSSAAAILMGRGEGSRLHRALVDEHKVASAIGVYAQKFMESGVFLVLVEPVAGKAAECRAIVQEEIKKAVEHGFTDRELEHMARSQAKGFFQKLQSPRSFTYEWLTSYFAHGDEKEVFTKVNQYVDLESSKVQEFLKEHIDSFMMNQIQVLPVPEEKRGISRQIRKEADETDAKILAKYVRTVPIEQPKLAPTLPGPKPLDFVFPKPDKVVTLKNGLKVLLRRHPGLPIMSVNCKFKEAHYFASAREGILIDLMMAMLIEGSEKFSKQELVDFFEFYGASYYYGSSGGALSLLSLDYEKILERFMHALTKPTFPGESLDKVKNIHIDGLVRSKDSPNDLAIRTLRSNVYQNHPFSWSYDEAIDDVRSCSTIDLIKLHKKYVAPENMILTIAGDFDLAKMEATITKIFGTWAEGPDVRVENPPATFEPGRVIKVPMLRDQVVLLLGQPSEIDIYHPDQAHLKLLNYIVFHSLGSRIYQLRERSGLFYTAFGAWAGGAGKEPGFDFMGAILNPENVEGAEKKMRELVNQLAQDGVTEQELASARQLYLKSLIDAVSNNSSVTTLLGTLEAFGLGFDYYDKVLKQVQSLTLDDANKLCAKYFNTDKMISVRVGRVNK